VVASLRQHLRDAINTALQDHPLRGIVQALAIGNRQQISPAQWDTLIRTGTSHLVAISGLHVGLVAGFAFFMARRGWRCSARAALLWPAHKAAAVVALFTASAYALLAGFSVPTQRALVMVAVVMLAVLLQRRTRVSSLLALALLAVLLLDPMAVLAAGFWLSFGAVAVIVYGMSGRSGESHRWWWRWGRAQWLVAVGLLPLLIGLFQQASLVAPLANLVAVPWVTLLSVPLTLLGSLLLGLIPGLGEGLLLLAAWSLQGLWWLLEMMGQWPQAQWQQGTAPWWAVACALPGVVWLLAPRGVPARWVGGVWLLPLLLARPAELAPGEAHFALLDVGQGLAAVVQTRRHVLVFDTGPRFSSGFNTGEAVLAPYLRARGIGHIDTLIVSHGDNDHRGGVEGLRNEFPVQRVLSSVPQRFRTRGLAQEVAACRDGQNWQWDGVQFTVLNPQAEAEAARSDNNRSCVLRVQAGSQRLLLTGDIEAAAEQTLVQRHGEALAAELLVVPHHGSLTSSTPEFIAAVAPRVALFPVGYRNRFGFPKPLVVERYRQRGVQLFDTAHHGALEIRLGDEAELRQIHAYRQDAARYWHHQPVAIPGRGEALATSGRSASLLQ
jgi:competence protein ComEC